MKSSLIRSGAAALVATLAFAACAGHGLVPSSGVPDTSDAVRVTPAAVNPCPIPVGWSFGGSCTAIAIATTGATGGLKAYQGITLSATLATNNAKKGTYLVFQDALDNGDIKNTKTSPGKFPKLKGAILYLAALNTNKKGFTFNGTPGLKITSTKAIPGKVCALNELTSKLKWNAPGINGAVKGKTVTFSSVPFQQQVPASTAGPFYLAFSCSG